MYKRETEADNPTFLCFKQLPSFFLFFKHQLPETVSFSQQLPICITPIHLDPAFGCAFNSVTTEDCKMLSEFRNFEG